ALWGLETALVTVEVDVANGLPAFVVVGLPDAAVQEARERVRAAIRNSGYDFPLRRVTVNLAPAERRKEGTGFDLAIALGILRASGQLAVDVEALCLGELALDGALRPVRGTMPRARTACCSSARRGRGRPCSLGRCPRSFRRLTTTRRLPRARCTAWPVSWTHGTRCSARGRSVRRTTPRRRSRSSAAGRRRGPAR